MEKPDTDTLDDSIVYEDHLPLQWQVLDAEPASIQLVRYNENNEQVLRMVSSLEEYGSDSTEEHNPQAPELARIEFKLNLLMDLMSRFIESSHQFPEKYFTRISASRLEWLQQQNPGINTGAVIKADLYLNTSYPVPMQLVGSVQTCEKTDDAYRCILELTGVSENTRELLEKLIFRHHRRSIAHQRLSRHD